MIEEREKPGLDSKSKKFNKHPTEEKWNKLLQNKNKAKNISTSN